MEVPVNTFNKKQYAFLQPAEELSSWILNKSRSLHRGNFSRLVDVARRSYNSYYNRTWSSDGSTIINTGEQGEYTALGINHFRNLLTHTQSLLTQTRLTFDTMALANDLSGRSACIIGNQVLEHALADHNLEGEFHRALELGLIMGTSFMTVEWNPMVRLVDVASTGELAYAGAPKVRVYSIFDMIWETWKDDHADCNWMCIRDMVNKWDLARVYSEHEDDIISAPQVKDLQRFEPFYDMQEDDTIFVYRCYHKETPAIPGGRYTVFLEGGEVLEDGTNPYIHPTQPSPNGGIPIFAFRPAIQYGNAYGYSVAFDLMPLQQALNTIESMILTNQETYGIQHIAAPREAGFNQTDLTGGSKLIEYNLVEGAPNGGQPIPLNLTATPPELFKHREEILREMELLSGISSVQRGQPQASLLSAAAVALVAVQAHSFNSKLEANYVRFCEEVAHFYLYTISRFQRTDELVALVGKGKSNEIKQFKGEDLAPVRKVKVSVGNALAKTLAGRVEIAEKLLSNQIIKSAGEYLEVLQTGNLQPALDKATAQSAYISYENEMMLSGQLPKVEALDNHPDHMTSHHVLTFQPGVRSNPRLLQLIQQHIWAHMDQMEAMSMGNPMATALALGLPIPMPVPAPDTGIGPNAMQPAPEGTASQPPQLSGAIQNDMISKSVQAMDNAKQKLIEAEG